MSRENVELVRRAVDAFNRGDLQAALDDLAPDAVWDWSNSHGPDAGVFRGHDEIRGFWRQFLDTFDELRFELDEVVEVEEGVLIADNVGYVQGREGIAAQARSAWLIATAGGQITSLTMYQTKQEALEAIGLSE
jgi:ketosteroid isomerase-like protein